MSLFSEYFGLTKYSVVGTVLDSTLIMAILVIGPGVFQALFALGHQCRSTEVRIQGCSIHAPGPAMGAMESSQSLVWSNPHIYAPTKPTAAKARPLSAAGAFVCSDVPPVFNLHGQKCGCKSVVHAARRRGFSSSFLVSAPRLYVTNLQTIWFKET